MGKVARKNSRTRNIHARLDFMVSTLAAKDFGLHRNVHNKLFTK